jgi:hypothetical protein
MSARWSIERMQDLNTSSSVIGAYIVQKVFLKKENPNTDG